MVGWLVVVVVVVVVPISLPHFDPFASFPCAYTVPTDTAIG